MKNEEKLRALIRKHIQEILDEISTSAGAGAYLTPNAFRGNQASGVKKMKSNANQLGYMLTKRGEDEFNRKADKMESVTEGKIRYHEYKNDDSMSSHQKIGKAISELNKNLDDIDRILKMNVRLKNEDGIASDRLWKRTQNGLVKLESKLLNIAGRLRDIRGN